MDSHRSEDKNMNPSIDEKEWSPADRDSCATTSSIEIVDFSEKDPENPINWPVWRKWTIVSLVTCAMFLGNFGTITIVPAVPEILHDFHTNGKFYLTFLVSIWELGEAVGQFFVGPAAERFGRMPVFLAGNTLFLVFNIASVLSVNVQMLTAFRFFCGCVNTTLTLGPSIVGDIFVAEERGRAMAAIIAIPCLGPFVAPVVGSYVSSRLGWRWAIWVVAIAVAAVTVMSFVFFKETYKVVILQHRAERLQKASNCIEYRSIHQKNENGWSDILLSMTRPVRMLVTSPALILVALYSGFTYGISYLILTTLTDVMESVYHFDEGAVGNAFLARAVGNVLGMLLYGLSSDRYLKSMQRKHGSFRPTDRLLHMVVGAVMLPVGLLLYGWTAEKGVHWIVPLIGTSIIGFSMILSMLPTNTYLVDTYDVHGASAVAAAAIVMALFATFLPLLGPPLYHSTLGLGWTSSLLAFVSVAFIPFLIWLLRARGTRIDNRAQV